MLCSKQAVETLSTYLPRQLNHLEIPGTQTVISVDSPVGHTVKVSSEYKCIVRVSDLSIPSQLKVLVHEPCQAAPVSVLKSHPEGRSVFNQCHGNYHLYVAS